MTEETKQTQEDKPHLGLELPNHARRECKDIVDVLVGKRYSNIDRIGSLSDLLDMISGGIGNGYMTGLLWNLRLRVLNAVTKLDDAAQTYLVTERLPEGALAAGSMDHGFPCANWKCEPTPDMEAIAEGGGMEACALLDWLLTYLLHDPNKGHDKEGDVIAQKSSAVFSALNASDESPEFLFLLSRLRKLFAAAGGQLPQDDETITPQRAQEITNAIITLMSGPLPERLSEDLGHALSVMASGPAVADTSTNPDMLRIWLPAVLEGGES